MHFFEIGSIYTFSILELLKLPKIAQISTPVRLYCAFLVGGKMAVILAVVSDLNKLRHMVIFFSQTIPHMHGILFLRCHALLKSRLRAAVM